MAGELGEESDLLCRAGAGDPESLRALFWRHRDRLKRMVHLRLSRRLAGPVYLGAIKRLREILVRIPGLEAL